LENAEEAFTLAAILFVDVKNLRRRYRKHIHAHALFIARLRSEASSRASFLSLYLISSSSSSLTRDDDDATKNARRARSATCACGRTPRDFQRLEISRTIQESPI